MKRKLLLSLSFTLVLISHLIFNLDEISQNKFENNEISSVTLNGVNKITAKMYKSYVSENLKCFNQ